MWAELEVCLTPRNSNNSSKDISDASNPSTIYMCQALKALYMLNDNSTMNKEVREWGEGDGWEGVGVGSGGIGGGGGGLEDVTAGGGGGGGRGDEWVVSS